MAHRFLCTACGKCCYGQIPLTVQDAWVHAQRFPLAMVWSPVREGSKDFKSVARFGTVVSVPKAKNLAVLIVPTAYLPPSFACPELTPDNLCAIHQQKPARCRTMPFYPYRDEQFQAELLVPRPGWLCDTSASAPIVFTDKQIVDRAEFDFELQALQEQHATILRYAEYMFKYTPQLRESLAKVAANPKAGQVVTSLSSFLTAIRHPDAQGIAGQQLPLLQHYAEQTAGQSDLQDFHRNYLQWMKEMRFLVDRV